MTYCAREFMHAQWDILLDEELREAWKHGIVIMCCDGIKRRFYPRIFTYSADYPEKSVGICHLYRPILTGFQTGSSLLASGIWVAVHVHAALCH